MGRQKQYEREDLLDRAIELFRTHGFNGTPTAALVEALGVNRKSMYAEFGSKQGLFLAALERYNRVHLPRVLAPLEAPGAGLDAIGRAFDGYASAIEGPWRGRGCLMCNTAVERAALDEESGVFVAAYLTRIHEGFHKALGNAQREGELAGDLDLEELASFLTTALIGVAASVRAAAPPEQVYASVRAIKAVLEGSR